MLREFRKFAMRGNVIDMAVGIIVGAAFGRIVASFVEDLLMPPLGMLTGKVDFSSLFISLTGESYASLERAKEAGAPTVNYGVFVNNVVHFVLVAFAVYLLVRTINRLRTKEDAQPPRPGRDVQLLEEIRDLLKAKA